MGNCLVTKLKQSVNNDNLEKLGVLTISLNKNGNNTGITIKASEANTCVISTTDGQNFSNIGENSVNIPSNEPIYITSAAESTVAEVTNKYKLVEFLMQSNLLFGRNTDYDVDIKELNYMPLLTKISLPLKGNIADWNTLGTNIIRFNLTACRSLFGNIGFFSKMRNITDLTLLECANIGGDVEKLVAGRVVLTDTSGNIDTLNILASNVKWKGSSTNGSGTISWNPNAINSSYTDIAYLSAETTISVDAQGNWNYVNADKSKYTGQ